MESRQSRLVVARRSPFATFALATLAVVSGASAALARASRACLALWAASVRCTAVTPSTLPEVRLARLREEWAGESGTFVLKFWLFSS